MLCVLVVLLVSVLLLLLLLQLLVMGVLLLLLVLLVLLLWTVVWVLLLLLLHLLLHVRWGQVKFFRWVDMAPPSVAATKWRGRHRGAHGNGAAAATRDTVPKHSGLLLRRKLHHHLWSL